MKLPSGDIVVVIAVAVFVVSVPIACVYQTRVQCENNWPNKFQPKFEHLQCTVEMEKGVRIPAANFRITDLNVLREKR